MLIAPWWFWLLLSCLWLVTGSLNALNGRSPTAFLLQFTAALLSAALAVIKLIRSRK